MQLLCELIKGRYTAHMLRYIFYMWCSWTDWGKLCRTCLEVTASLKPCSRGSLTTTWKSGLFSRLSPIQWFLTEDLRFWSCDLPTPNNAGTPGSCGTVSRRKTGLFWRIYSKCGRISKPWEAFRTIPTPPISSLSEGIWSLLLLLLLLDL